MKKTLLYVLFATLACLCLAMFTGCENTGDDDDDDTGNNQNNPFGTVIGFVIDAIDGSRVVGSTIRAVLDTGGWTEVVSDEFGVFVLENVPVSSSFFVDFHKDGYCPMNFMLNTEQAEHSGQITDVILEVFPADSSLTAVLTMDGYFLSEVEINITPLTYDAFAESTTTNDEGRAVFELAMNQSYDFFIPSQDIDKDGIADFKSHNARIDMTMAEQLVYIELEPLPVHEMELLSVGVSTINAICLFSENIKSFGVLGGRADNGVELNSTFPATMAINGPQVMLTPNVIVGALIPGTQVEFDIQAQGAQSDTWWEGTITYIVEGTGTGDDDDDDDDDDATDGSPYISGGYWEPNPVAYDYSYDGWLSALVFEICDKENNLVGGSIYAYISGTTDLLWVQPVFWSDFSPLPNVSNCTDPEEFGIATLFSSGSSPPGFGNINLCVDLEVTDGQNNWSNLLTNLCVVVP